MNAYDEDRPARHGPPPSGGGARGLVALGGLLLLGLGFVMALYNSFKIEVDTGQQAVLIRREGLELEPEMEVAPPPKDGKYYYKGVQSGGPNNGVLTEGRYFYNPYYWSWEISPQFVVPGDKIGIRIALSGEDMPPVQVLAEPGQKGILREVLKPGRYPYNPYAESIELHDPVTIPAGLRGVVTRLAGPMSKDPNVFLVQEGERGVQPKTLDPGTYYLNPYEIRVSQVDCRSRRFNLGQDSEMSFLSADGFPIMLDGVVEFRILPEKVAEMFVKYNESANGDAIDEEIIAKIITPESRSLCRIGGSKLSGGQFISGQDREKFQTDLVKSLTENCQKQGIEILAVAITSIQPPGDITQPVQQREVAKQKLAQFMREKLQQLSEAKLRVQVVLAEQKKRVVEAEQEVVEKTTKAEEEQKVAQTLAEQKLKVAQTQLEATKDKASAILAKAEAEADVIKFDNAAEAAGLAAQVSAFDGDGSAMARNMLLGKLAPSFRTILGNSEGPLMDLFSQFTQRPGKPRSLSPAAGPAPRIGARRGAPGAGGPTAEGRGVPAEGQGAPAEGQGAPAEGQGAPAEGQGPEGSSPPRPATEPATNRLSPTSSKPTRLPVDISEEDLP